MKFSFFGGIKYLILLYALKKTMPFYWLQKLHTQHEIAKSSSI